MQQNLWRRSFRAIYRDERAKMKEEQDSDPAYNPYVRWLGYLAFVGLLFGFVAPMVNVIWGEPDVLTGQEPEFDPFNPAFVFGVACGLLWLAVKAIITQQNGNATSR